MKKVYDYIVVPKTYSRVKSEDIRSFSVVFAALLYLKIKYM